MAYHVFVRRDHTVQYTVKQLAELAGISARTLRYYHQIGLLSPECFSEAGYRLYGPAQVDRLQQILFYRELGLALEEIASLLDDPDFDRLQALQSHLAALRWQRERLDSLILTVEKTIQHETGGTAMTDIEKFEGFKRQLIQQNEELYGPEIRAKYGNQEIDRSNVRILSLTREEYDAWNALGAEILTGLEQAVRAHADPGGEVGKRLAELHRRWLSYAWVKYSPAAHKGLAQMYVCDERFTAYYDRNVPGCAAFLRDAILAHI